MGVGTKGVYWATIGWQKARRFGRKTKKHLQGSGADYSPGGDND